MKHRLFNAWRLIQLGRPISSQQVFRLGELMPSLGAARKVDVEVMILKEVDPDYVPAGAGDVNYGLVDAGGRRRIAEFIAIGKRDEHLFIVCDDIGTDCRG